MYRRCIYCSADLGSNQAVEEFPVGRSLAFDGWKGRLWAVCPKCRRWNLAPLEERWEAVESAERLFRDTRLRAQSENVGLARLPDGTRLIRVGRALPGELAAWRYGTQLRRRYVRTRAAVTTASIAGASVGALAAPLIGPLGVAGIAAVLAAYQAAAWTERIVGARRVVHVQPREESPTGEALHVRRIHLARASLDAGAAPEELTLRVPVPRSNASEPSIVLRGGVARRVLARALVARNSWGADRKLLAASLDLLSAAGSAEAFLARTAGQRSEIGQLGLWRAESLMTRGKVLDAFRADRDLVRTLPESVALEMALHEESERRALEGELAALEAAWREAEELAQIADVLPEDPLRRWLSGRREAQPGRAV